MSRIAFLLSFSVVFAGYALSVDRALIADGDYAAEKPLKQGSGGRPAPFLVINPRCTH